MAIWRRPELTAEKFVPDPFSEQAGARLYRTGDLVRLSGGWELEFLGRADEQVKVRGYRIELGEIEAVLGEHEGVQEAVVVVRERSGWRANDWWPIVVVEGGAGAEQRGVAEWLREKLPEYMVPQAVRDAE